MAAAVEGTLWERLQQQHRAHLESLQRTRIARMERKQALAEREGREQERLDREMRLAPFTPGPLESILELPEPTFNENSGRLEFGDPLHAHQDPDLLLKAELMYESGLTNKAKRQAVCQQLGRRCHCSNTECGRKYFHGFGCRNRYCPNCGRRSFDELFGKHLRRLITVVDRIMQRRGFVIAKLDLTTVNLGRMPTREEVRVFNQCIRRFVRLLERELRICSQDFGVLYCDEFGGKGNTNLHAHAVYVGPVIPRQWFGKGKVVSELWKQVCTGTPFHGSFIISMKPAVSFAAALAHALKYAGKFLSKEPERLAALELAFHGVRRVHALGVFYNPAQVEPEAQEPSRGSECPHCRSALIMESFGFVPIVQLMDAGYQDLDEARREAGREKGFSGAWESP